MFKRLFITAIVLCSYSGLFAAEAPDSTYTSLTKLHLTEDLSYPQQDAAVYNIPISGSRGSDGSLLNLPDTEDLGQPYISYSSGEMVLSGNSPNGDTQTDVSYVQYGLPPEYADGESVTIRIYAAYSSGASDGSTKTIDVSCYERRVSDGSAFTDLCTTSAGTLTGTGTAFDFVVTPTNLAASDDLIIQVTTAFQDASTVGEAEIYAIQAVLDINR